MAEHQAHRANHNHILWALLNFAMWHRMFIEHSPAASGTGNRMLARLREA
jgi:hypothetical protein